MWTRPMLSKTNLLMTYLRTSSDWWFGPLSHCGLASSSAEMQFTNTDLIIDIS